MATITEQKEFIKKIYPAAQALWRKGGIHPAFVTAQAALETGWKVRGTGNNVFGITRGSSWTGRVELCLTTEYYQRPDVKFKSPERVVSVTPSGNRYKYRVWRYFRVYDSLEDCLDDHLALLRKPMYADAWPYRNDPREYARRIVDGTGAKYATAPDYARTMIAVIATVEKLTAQINGLD